jgi:hypothetical protein
MEMEMETETTMKTQNTKGKLVARVPSDHDGRKKYRIVRVGRGLVCACLAFRFAHGPVGSWTKTCKHIMRLRQATGFAFDKHAA